MWNGVQFHEFLVLVAEFADDAVVVEHFLEGVWLLEVLVELVLLHEAAELVPEGASDRRCMAYPKLNIFKK